MMVRRLVSMGLGVVLLLAVPGVAFASWVGAGSGDAFTGAVSMPGGPTPTSSATGRTVTVNWPAVQFPDSTNVNAYVIKRYNTSDVAQTIGASCDGTITSLTCTESAVPPGIWTYTVTPKHGAWLGAEGPESVALTVDPPSMSFSSSTTLSSLPSVLSGSVSNFLPGETLTFRLDDPSSGTILSGSVTPSSIPASGTSAITVTIPVLVSAGSHTVYAIGSLGSQASKTITVQPHDVTAPTVSSAVIAKSAGGVGGFIKQGGQYYVYANPIDLGSPTSGLSTVRANVSAITTGATNVSLSLGVYTVEGVVYTHRSAIQTANNPLTAGSKNFTITATDIAGNASSPSFSVTVDNTAPTATDVQTTNVGGGTDGKAETGDTITFTYSETLDPYSILAGWNGSSTAVTVRLRNSGGGDRFEIWNGLNLTQLPLGLTRLNRTDYTTATVNFLTSTMVRSGSTITITLGLPSGATTTAAASAAMTLTPSATATDRAANASSTAVATETGAADKDF